MTWTKLTDLPDQRLPLNAERQLFFWEIVDGKVVHQDRPKRHADVETFELLDGSSFIARDKNFIYNAWTTLKSVDRDSFKSLGNHYFRDKNLGYFDFETSLKPLKGSTVEDLKVLKNGYARDKNFAYYYGRAIKACQSPLTFEVVPQTGEHPIFAGWDEHNCYYEGGQLRGADPKTWELLDLGFSRDARGIYFGSKKLGGATPSNWTHLTHPYSTNGQKIYYMNFVIKGADPDSFEVLPDGTARDKISKFSGTKRVTVSD